MKKTSTRKAHTTDRMRKEYRFDYSKARPNRFAMRKKERLIVILDPDVSKVFDKPETVNSVLRALIATMPQSRRGKVAAK
jgi:transcription elongation factor